MILDLVREEIPSPSRDGGHERAFPACGVFQDLNNDTAGEYGLHNLAGSSQSPLVAFREAVQRECGRERELRLAVTHILKLIAERSHDIRASVPALGHLPGLIVGGDKCAGEESHTDE